MKTTTYTVTQEDLASRSPLSSSKLEKMRKKTSAFTLIDALSSLMKLSSRGIRDAKNEKRILLNGRTASVNSPLHAGDKIEILPKEEANTFAPEPIKIDILYEDDDILAVSKPPFLVVHPTLGHPHGTLINAVSYLQKTRGENYKIRLINRLDRDTSGIVLIAKNAHAQQFISKQMMHNETVKKYVALLEGDIRKQASSLPSPAFETDPETTLKPRSEKISPRYYLIDAPIAKSEEEKMIRTVSSDGQPSQTVFHILQANPYASLVDIHLLTGRTHQIRVHMRHIQHPVLSDHLYGTPSAYIDRQALHCYSMKLKKTDGSDLLLYSPLPEDFILACRLCSFPTKYDII